MTALPSHLPAFSFFGGSLFFSGGLFCPVAVSSSSRQQTFFFFGGSLFFLRWPFLSRCCFLFFPPANFLFFFCGSLFPFGSLSRSVAVSSSSRQQTFFFFGGSLFPFGSLSRSVAVSSSSRQQTFFFFGGSLFPLRRPFSSRCRFSFLSCKLFLSSAVLFFPLQSFLFRNGFPRCFSG